MINNVISGIRISRRKDQHKNYLKKFRTDFISIISLNIDNLLNFLFTQRKSYGCYNRIIILFALQYKNIIGTIIYYDCDLYDCSILGEGSCYNMDVTIVIIMHLRRPM